MLSVKPTEILQIVEVEPKISEPSSNQSNIPKPNKEENTSQVE